MFFSLRKKTTTEMESAAKIGILDMVEKEYPDIMPEILQHRISEECLAVFNPNGSIRKCQKSKLVDVFQLIDFNEKYSTAIFDMSYYWRLAMPTSEEYDKGKEKQFTWNDYAHKMWQVNHCSVNLQVILSY